MAAASPTPDSPRSAIILAAGLGVRMRPLTLDQPKALVSLAGRPLIDYALDHLAAAGVATVTVNVHHQGEQLIRYLGRQDRPFEIRVSDEQKALLETGGGIRKALALLGPGPFFAANCDAWFPDPLDNPFRVLAAAWRGGIKALLLVVPRERAAGYRGAGDFFLAQDGRLTRRGGKGTAPYVFAGAQILDPALFAEEREEAFSLNRVFDRALAKKALFGVVYPGAWFHIGTPEDIAPAEVYLARHTGGG